MDITGLSTARLEAGHLHKGAWPEDGPYRSKVYVDAGPFCDGYGIQIHGVQHGYVLRYIGFLKEEISRKETYTLVFVPSKMWLDEWLDGEKNENKLADGGKSWELVGKLSDLLWENDQRLQALKTLTEYELIGDKLAEDDPDIKAMHKADNAIKGASDEAQTH